MEAKRETFVMHAEYIEDLPEEAKAQFLIHIYNYGIHGIVPELAGFEKTAWIKIQRRIDADIETYEKKCANLKQFRNKKPSETDNTESDTENTESETENEKSAGDIEFEFVNEFVNESENESEAPKAPLRESPPLQDYAKKVFETFKAAGLPCARGNFISFLQRDFKAALGYLHKAPGLEHLHSDDVIGAVENYARTVNDPASFITGRYSFDRFVTFKNFVDFLPANYNAENFKDKKAAGTAPPEKKRWKQECPGCHAQALEWDNDTQNYRCASCGKTYSYEEITGG